MAERWARPRSPRAIATAAALVISRTALTSCRSRTATVVPTTRRSIPVSTTVSTRSSACLRPNEPEFVAFYVEPVQATGGYIIPPPEYFSRLKKILDERKILLVDDEIQMGFFRTGKFWAIEHFGVKPNNVVFGKAMTNGLNPISGLWAHEALISPEKFPPGSTHSTFASNPLGTAATLATLLWIEQQHYEKKVMESGAYFLRQLETLQKRHKTIGDVSGLGLALRIE